MFSKIIALVLSFFIGFFSYPMSFLPSNYDTSFHVNTGSFFRLNGDYLEPAVDGKMLEDSTIVLDKKVTVDLDYQKADWFNYFTLSYKTDAYVKGAITYKAGVVEKTEEFFLEPAENGNFSSFIDNCLNGTKADGVYSLSFEPLNVPSATIKLRGLDTFNREIPDREVYIEADGYKIGVDMLWGGALSYLEDTNSNVEAVKVDGRVYVDSNASERYGKKAFSKNVNLINRFDPGRLVQQSYYGTGDCEQYTGGVFMDQKWNYNPVQGGNQYNESSKIVDLRCDGNSIYIKCRPLDWSLPKENITPSYMEATYTITNGAVHVECRYVDFSGYPVASTSQEIPAFYCIEPFNRFVYANGGEIKSEPDLIFWPDAGYPKFFSDENWSAFVGQEEDSFGIGVYVEGEQEFLSGVFGRGGELSKDPSKDAPTSYIAVIEWRNSTSYDPYTYDYYLATGNTNEIRTAFNAL